MKLPQCEIKVSKFINSGTHLQPKVGRYLDIQEIKTEIEIKIERLNT